MSDPFAYKEIGDPTVAGSKWGQISGTSTDVIYPVSQLIDDNFKEGSTVSFNWRSDRFRHWSARNTRLMIEYEAMYGECNETCADPATGPANAFARPPRSLRMTSMPNSCMFSSQARFVQNNVTLKTTNNLYEQTQLQLLLTSKEAGTKTSGSNMLPDLSKSKGIPGGIMYGSQADYYKSNAYAMLPVEPAPYLTTGTQARVLQTGTDALGISMGKIQNAAVTKTFTVGAVAAQTDAADLAELPIVLSSNAGTAAAELAFLFKMASAGELFTVTAVASGSIGNFGASSSNTVNTTNLLDTADADAGTSSTVTLVLRRLHQGCIHCRH